MDDIFIFLLITAGISTVIYIIILFKDKSVLNFWRWLSIGLLGALLIYVLGLATQRYPAYFLWSSAIAALLALISYFAHDRKLTSTGWLGLLILTNNVLFVALSFFLRKFEILIIGGILLVAILVVHALYSQHQRYIWNVITIAVLLVATLGTMVYRPIIRSDIDYLNEVILANYQKHYTETQQANNTYEQTQIEAENCRTIISNEFASSTQDSVPYSDLVAEDIKNAGESHERAIKGLQELPERTTPFHTYSVSAEEEVSQQLQQLGDVHHDAFSALNSLNNVCQTSRDLASAWTLTILWTEIGDYWSSEENDSPDKRLCYYGELYTVSTTNYTVQNGETSAIQNKTEQVIIDDSSGGDSESINWKVFRFSDYERMVQDKWIPPIPNSSMVTEEQVTDYLCGSNGIIPEGTTFIKEYGSTVVEMEDMENIYVGDTRYGSWCRQNSDGTITLFEGENPPLDAQSEWCWYQQPGGSTAYYYIRTGSPGFYTYTRGPMRCVYCTPQNSWQGSHIVPDSTLSKINGTDASTYRRPSDMGGGPNSGK